jgi:small subunit ribosomal protein S20
LANIKSQIKRDKQNGKQRLRNRVARGTARSFVKKAQTSIKTGDAVEAKTETMKAIKALDKAAAKGVIHKNNAARRKARLMKQLKNM